MSSDRTEKPTKQGQSASDDAAPSGRDTPRMIPRLLLLTAPRMQGLDVEVVQRTIGMTVDGIYGPFTEARVRQWQRLEGLKADGVVGELSWRKIGYELHTDYAAPAAAVLTYPGDPRAPACVAALRDANARWPERNRRSDGIMGDTRHKATTSDHNSGNAVDITHDPASGCDGRLIAALAIDDPRVTYVIHARRIWRRAAASAGWLRYPGSNPHETHVHISVDAAQRDNAAPWEWAPK